MATERIDMGRVTTAATIENIEDLVAVELGVKAADEMRSATVDDALVDTERRCFHCRLP